MYHFRDLAAAWRRFKDDPDAWVAIVTGVGESFCVGADLKTYIPQVTDLQRKIATGEITEIDGCKLSDGTYAVLRNVKIYKPIIGASTASAWPGAWRCWVASTSELRRPRPASR